LTPYVIVFPRNFCHENKEGDDDAEEQPPVNELHVGCLWQCLRNSLMPILQNTFSSSLHNLSIQLNQIFD
jgi:hypothetical protein